MANNIDFNVSTNAVTVLNQTAGAAENTAKGFTSAKAELRALNQQLLQMDQASDEFKKASARAAELKDNISDLGAEINANAGNAFEGLSNNVGLFGSRLMDLDLAGAGQALKNMGTNVSKIDFKTLQKEVGGLIGGFASLGKAILANPILLLVGAIVAIIANFDKLIKLFPSVEKGLSGINEQERESLALSKAKADASQKAYENIDKQANILKLQGKSEKEILNIKIKALETAIADRKAQLAITEKQAIVQVQTAKRNREILEGIIRFLSAPLELLLTAVDKIAEYVGVDSKLAEGFVDLAAGLLIDPEELESELNKTIEENKAAIATMENDYAGLKLSVQSMDKKASDDKKAADKKIQQDNENAQKDADEKELERRKKLNTDLEAEDERMALIGYEDLKAREKKKTDAKLLAQMEAHAKTTALTAVHSQKELETSQKLEEQKKQQRIQLAEQGFSALSALGDAYFSSQLANVQAGSKAELDLKKKQFAFNKKMQIGGAIMDTAKAITAAIAANPFPSPTLPVSIALASITGAAQIAKIASTKFDGGGGSSSGVNIPTTGGDGTTAPSPANYDFISQQPNQQPPLQAYVVGTQVSSNLEAQQLIQNQSRLGG
jgi:hypothetical protein